MMHALQRFGHLAWDGNKTSRGFGNVPFPPWRSPTPPLVDMDGDTEARWGPGRTSQFLRNVLATRPGHPKTHQKGRIFEPRYFHHNAMQLYEILCVSEINSVTILLCMTSASNITVR
jgi:hypothetical protein